MKIENFLNFLILNMYSKNTVKTYTSVLNRYLYVFNDVKKIKHIISNYFNSPNTAWTHFNIICSYMNWSKDKRIKELKQFKLPRIPKIYRAVFNKEFLLKKTLINEFDSKSLVQKKLLMKFLFETGIRAEELKKIIEINRKTIVIIGKGNKIREIFHCFETTEKLEKFTLTTKTLRAWVKEILGSEFTPHSIRRSHATHLLTHGASPKMVMLQLGHEKIETTFRYLNLSVEDNWKIYSGYI
ncbi:integrase [Spiroplasma sabaudiense Ar-1343]|uniref:Integrase n=1 Tax=Spiroplasma sabaudiense Ar-1343 TaxID=1276257 RepID=W6AA13_9MOLU|nr:site-specific integrase [Spiroplasma sabaudiense]AHI53831.1 integrase [Spiroplasma sabaudiense Ar-1343]